MFSETSHVILTLEKYIIYFYYHENLVRTVSGCCQILFYHLRRLKNGADGPIYVGAEKILSPSGWTPPPLPRVTEQQPGPPLPSLHFFDDTPLPAYPYLKTPSSYSAVIQLYARSGQLDTAYTLANHLGDIQQPWCRFGCPCAEEPNHVFVQCRAFAPLRSSYLC